ARRARAWQAETEIPVRAPDLPQSDRTHAVACRPRRTRRACRRARTPRLRGRPLRSRAHRGRTGAAAPRALARARSRRALRVRELILEDRRARSAGGISRAPGGACRGRRAARHANVRVTADPAAGAALCV